MPLDAGDELGARQAVEAEVAVEGHVQRHRAGSRAVGPQFPFERFDQGEQRFGRAVAIVLVG